MQEVLGVQQEVRGPHHLKKCRRKELENQEVEAFKLSDQLQRTNKREVKTNSKWIMQLRVLGCRGKKALQLTLRDLREMKLGRALKMDLNL